MLQDVFQKISLKGAKGELDSFMKDSAWSELSEGDREHLSLLFVERGEQQLALGDQAFADSFSLASKIAPNSSQVWLLQGRALGSQHRNIRCLKLACEACEKAASLNESSFDVWYTWAKVLMKVGLLNNETADLREADAKFSQALAYLGDKNPASGSFFWDWGMCWYCRGKISGEAIDFKMAVKRYGEVVARGIHAAPFWNDYGNALVDLGCLVGKPELALQALQLYDKALNISQDYFPAHLNKATCYGALYEASGAEDFFRSAEECFRSGSAINGDDVTLWLKWGGMHFSAAKKLQDVKRLESAVEKFKRADAIEPHSAIILQHCSEAQAALGEETDQLELLRAAEQKIIEACQIAPEGALVWSVYGTILNALGNYFDDADFYRQAIDKFQFGLSLHPKENKLLHGMAQSYYAIGDMLNDRDALNRSLDCFSLSGSVGEVNSSDFWNDWGVALMRLSQLADSRVHLEEAVSKFEYAIKMQGGDQDTTTLNPELLYNYGCALDFLGDFSDDTEYYESAIKVLSQVLILDPDYFHARYNLGLAYLHLGDISSDVECFQAAICHFRGVLKEDGEDEMAWNDLGLALINLSRLIDDPARRSESVALFKEAEEALRRALSFGSLPAFYNMAALQGMTGQTDMAIHYLERALDSQSLPTVDEMLHDEWLQGLHGSDSFKQFLSHLPLKERHT